MEEDGTYEDFLSGIEYNYDDLEAELTPPNNMYNGRGPCLRHGVARRFETVMGCYRCAVAWIISFSSALLLIQMNMQGCI